MPTWFEVRVNNKGYLGSRGGVDIAVAMNPQTYSQDVEEISEGGYLYMILLGKEILIEMTSLLSKYL